MKSKLTKEQRTVVEEIVSRKEEIKDLYEKDNYSEIGGNGMVHAMMVWAEQHNINLDCINSTENPMVGKVTLLVFD